MTIQEVIDAILDYHPELILGKHKTETVDTFKSGNPSDECSGIVTTCAPSIDVIRKTAELGYNLIVCHEPAYYSHLDPTDWLEDDEVYLEKSRLLNENNIAIWRDHDHMHLHRPDLIFHGIMKVLGWEEYLTGDPQKPLRFTIPKTTVKELCGFFKEKLGLNGVRVIGNVEAEVSKIGFCEHVRGSQLDDNAIKMMMEDDLLIPLELVDWSVANYANDAGQLGKNKAILHVGHFNFEEVGMEYAAEWISSLVKDAVSVKFIRSGDLYKYVT